MLPAASTAGALGVFSLFLPFITGVPAIVIGFRALRELPEKAGAYGGREQAVIGIALGTFSTAAYAGVAGMLAGRGSVSAGAACAFGAVIAGGALLALGRSKAWRPAARRVAQTPAVALLLGVVFGVLAVRGEATAARAACDASLKTVRSALAGGNLIAARNDLRDAEYACPTDRAAVDSLTRDVDAREAAQQAAAAADAARVRERRAVADFPQVSALVTGELKGAKRDVAGGKWADAIADLDAIDAQLLPMAGTSVASAPTYADLTSQVRGLREKLRPHAEDIARDIAAVQAAAAAAEVARGPKPSISAWNGSVRCVERYLKRVLNDPSSYEHVRTYEPQIDGDHWRVVTQFRAKNGFGALTVHTATAKVQRDEVISLVEDEE